MKSNDGYRTMVLRAGDRVRVFTRNGIDRPVCVDRNCRGRPQRPILFD
jgi:hypothetical protein